ncbi:hypothetical protein [Rhodococcus sp. NPDC004095]
MSDEALGALVVFGGGAILIGLICGAIASSIAGKKGLSRGGFWLLGFFFSVIGVIVALLVSPGEPAAPPGMRAVTCPRCNARQNVDVAQGRYECWQCKLVSQTPATPVSKAKAEPEDWRDWLGKDRAK